MCVVDDAMVGKMVEHSLRYRVDSVAYINLEISRSSRITLFRHLCSIELLYCIVR